MSAEQITKFKSAHVGKDSNLMEEIEKLPENLKHFWQLGNSFDWKVHRLIRECYELCDKLQHRPTELVQSLARSCNKYVLNILCTKKIKLVPYRYIDPYRFITWCLNFSCVPDVLSNAIEKQTLSVEPGHIPDMDTVFSTALEFMDKLYIYPLDPEILKFPELPGVYFIHYVGETDLYEGSQVSPSTDCPVYVGHSQKSIADRLRDHYKTIEAAKNLHLTDFVVRFMIVDLARSASAPVIEKMLIEHFSPVWNIESEVGFSFGNANSETKCNTWNKFHIQEDGPTIVTMLEKLRIG
ncbi:hypothetical protein OS493_038294 [Desmophyllum pertusum]|uniref:GIY-YIG domain-containing protein n=1 Tax=Desmophyllum pertusum TaxID=174260 RepID=A0A9W9ZJ41_9CNID|nr:hypothetical protein OS493_038294 [Desmophyllum pertusum]